MADFDDLKWHVATIFRRIRSLYVLPILSVMLLLSTSAPAGAGLLLSLTNAAQSGRAGDTLAYSGTLTNTSAVALQVVQIIPAKADSPLPAGFAPFAGLTVALGGPGSPTPLSVPAYSSVSATAFVLFISPTANPRASTEFGFSLLAVGSDNQVVVTPPETATITVTVTKESAVPEPSTALLAGIVPIILVMRPRKRDVTSDSATSIARSE